MLLNGHFGDDGFRVVGPWRDGFVHGTIFALRSDRFPEDWGGRLLDVNEQAKAAHPEFDRKLILHPDPQREEAVLRWAGFACGEAGVTALAKLFDR